MDNWWVNALWSITPTVLIGVFFAVILRLILRADRNERRIYREMEAEERERLGLPQRTSPPGTDSWGYRPKRVDSVGRV